MKLAPALLCAALGLAPPLAVAGPAAVAVEPVYGVWMRGGHTEKMEFYDCAGNLCARGLLPGLDGSPPLVILRNAAKIAPNQWRGDLFNPENGKIYGGTITLNTPTQLTLTGCLVAFLCQSETWTKVPPPVAPTSRPPKGATH